MNTLPKPEDIIKGETDYYLLDFAKDLREYTDEMIGRMKKKYDKDDMYKIALSLIMLSAEEKTVVEIGKATGQKEIFITTGQNLLAEFIEVCRAIHMRMFIDIMEKYSSNTHMTLTILNMEIKKFFHSEVCTDQHENV